MQLIWSLIHLSARTVLGGGGAIPMQERGAHRQPATHPRHLLCLSVSLLLAPFPCIYLVSPVSPRRGLSARARRYPSGRARCRGARKYRA
jgi:hypothetical protein